MSNVISTSAISFDEHHRFSENETGHSIPSGTHGITNGHSVCFDTSPKITIFNVPVGCLTTCNPIPKKSYADIIAAIETENSVSVI